jgi:hypothetical protein
MEGEHPVERIHVIGVRYAPVQSRLNSPQSVKVSGEPVEVRLRADAGLCLPIDEAVRPRRVIGPEIPPEAPDP